MKTNMGRYDRILRLAIAITIAVLYFNDVITGITGSVLLIVAGIFTLTSLWGWCPIYAAFSISTKPKHEDRSRSQFQ